MAYETSNPPMLVSQGIGGPAGSRIWVYVDGDAAGTVDAADYVSNGSALGMKVSDNFVLVDTATPLTTWHTVDTVTAGGAANIDLGTTIGSATSGD
jgi:hypothetical protein